ncbi:hypothetical protein QM467_18280 [Rhodoblastus sp. 17X3]|uniref:hypothetical protein n=1 Tax=Rhodoblastus sp. 17X3 TaxID=3047026 RepID=UPI0024B842F2|nr:hypothetical protein [Rhodoblastus sp. 17X3]MDI9849990.1 hypothetical protein [Rhodoblastus sp. 17X3]
MTQPLASKDRVSVANALAGDGVVVAARLIAFNGLLAESAAARGDLAEAFAKLRLVAHALDEARDIVTIAGRIAK